MSPDRIGKCVICGQKTTNTKAGEFVCGYEDDNSLACSTVWNDRIARQFKQVPEYDIHPFSDDAHNYLTSRDEYNDYDSYIASHEWEAKARDAKRKAGNRCQECGSRRKIQAHHKHYKTLYKERSNDIEVLCDRCHARRHGK
jgi:DNA-directed RNA polymerase subunit RPC12/RpoP